MLEGLTPYDRVFMREGLTLKILWFEVDAIKVTVSCSNGHFKGSIEIYLGHDEILEFASSLSGFPSTVSDVRVLELGTFNPTHAGGGLRTKFHCADSSGHVVADVQLRGDECEKLGEIESVALRLRLEPASIDSFVQQLKTMNITVGALAFLTAAV